jgi:hypothetical protein
LCDVGAVRVLVGVRVALDFVFRCVGWTACCAGLAACHHARAPAPAGTSSFTFIDGQPDEPPRLLRGSGSEQPRVPVDALVPAEPVLPLARPVFPPAARGKTALPMMVGVRLTVGTDGRVADVVPSFVAVSTPGPFAAEFRAAVEAAVAEWRFLPAEIRHLVPGRTPQGKDYWNVARTDKTEDAIDVVFTFSPSGEVGTALPK